jgi:hypothetical protein
MLHWNYYCPPCSDYHAFLWNQYHSHVIEVERGDLGLFNSVIYGLVRILASTTSKWPINPVTNSNPNYSHFYLTIYCPVICLEATRNVDRSRSSVQPGSMVETECRMSKIWNMSYTYLVLMFGQDISSRYFLRIFFVLWRVIWNSVAKMTVRNCWSSQCRTLFTSGFKLLCIAMRRDTNNFLRRYNYASTLYQSIDLRGQRS